MTYEVNRRRQRRVLVGGDLPSMLASAIDIHLYRQESSVIVDAVSCGVNWRFWFRIMYVILLICESTLLRVSLYKQSSILLRAPKILLLLSSIFRGITTVL